MYKKKKDVLYINSINPNSRKAVPLSIYDISGRLVKKQFINSVNSSNKVNVSSLPSGVYFIRAGKKNLGKIVKLK